MILNLRDIYLVSEQKSKAPKKRLDLKSLYLKEKPESATLKLQARSLEEKIERAINESVFREENENLEDKMSSSGFAYESVVIDALRKAKANGVISEGAGASSTAADADMNIFGKIFNVEVKLNKNAQMGGSSVRYDNGKIELVTEMEDSTRELLTQVVESRKEEIEDLLEYLIKENADDYPNSKTPKFPISVTKDAWNKAKAAGKLICTKIPLTTDFISEHYDKKGINYIQIGGSGLFYMKKNPANLPVPKLDGRINVEIRSARSGSKKLKNGLRSVGAGIRVQGRLKTKNSSPYTLDDPKSIQEMISKAKQSKKKKTGEIPKKNKKASERPNNIGN